jgi:TonB family protein
MKTILFIFICTICSFAAKAQITDTLKKDTTTWRKVEESPEFVGGIGKLMKFINKNLKYPEEAKEAKLEGRVTLTFVVEKDGSISGVSVQKSLSPETDAEAVRLINAMPKWIPGKANGQPVRVRFQMPISFKLDN